MPIDSMTNEVMRRIPAGLRPNPWNLQEPVMGLIAKGWTPADIFAAIMADKPQQPGHVIAAARRLGDQPPPSTGQGWAYGHGTCDNPTHDPKCQVCRCNKGRIDHIVPVPMPQRLRQEFARLFAGWGRVDE